MGGYARELSFVYEDGMLTENEERLADKLVEQKYSKPGWNMGREFIHVD